jgi:ZIP family zinc transporter
MLHGARLSLCEFYGTQSKADGITALLFFGGVLLAAAIDRLIPEAENPHELHNVEEMNGEDNQNHHHGSKKLRHAGIFSAIALAIHNFPEGIATFMAAESNPSLGVAIAVAIALHNIPEGVAVSIPIYYATGSKKRAFAYSLLSGLAEPFGALLAFLVLMPFMNDVVLGAVLSAVAGIMVYISIDELLPAAREYGKPHVAIWGMVVGLMIMAASVILL